MLYKDITHDLLENHFGPITVTRDDKGIGEKNEIRFPIHESIQFNNLPMIIETVGSEEQVEQLIPKWSIVKRGIAGA
ncbi:DUF190 domain-containing protein [Ferviditalea candida]|uniref:DUF190 domain-containing protein n=1 Tax=Ferviditalea candida TaxID=3108399 RepID=A0ABU5ZNI7_9BACL|nr:DUF190 domain-containing protein [Paenibacillaceae bacterium T2]